MAEVIVRDGTWTFDGEIVRIVPGGDRRVHALRQALGERAIPLAAISGITYESARKGGRLRLRLRDGADPFLQVTAGKLADDVDPYRLAVDKDSAGVAEYFVDEVRNALTVEQVPPGACERYLLSGPGVPLTATAGDGTVTFDGSVIRIEWTEWAEQVKKASGAREISLGDVHGVEWVPIVGLTNGFLRFRVTGASALLPKHDPNCITWGWRREGGTISLVGAAVVARLPHPSGAPTDAATARQLPQVAGSAEASGPDGSGGAGGGADHDTVLRRLRELGDLHRDGILTDDEFAAAKQALLRQL
ncbi:DUF4429 domain-containing protein [Phytoactinopolyspora halotolerans]|uniref:DUF4429 domain-containing protein n=1 Tax=Phytoactinopolyspora halotolerans TaxID=1981512 RepID=A0A6L9SEG2_9ACTN|nr:DUF4429 domain-containing protein [Phytoactinopolyspora halotolerans]NEE02994.1 DUF4429 domain-containing protein [Phytoactinopolyspora halotolerans]